MTDDARPFDPPADLIAVAGRVTAAWVRRAITRAAAAGGVASDDWSDLEPVAAATATAILQRLRDLLDTDVDDQRTNPLSIYRTGLGPATDLLRRHGVPEPAGDRFTIERLADDPYQLGPAAWTDIDPDLQTPGLVWGAWKAKTILDRRRAEGRR